MFPFFPDHSPENLFNLRARRDQHRFGGWSLDDRDPRAIQAWMPIWGWLYQHYFRVQTSGWEHLPESGPMLIVGSHNGGLAAPDMFMCLYDWFQRFGPDRLAYGLMHPTVWQVPIVAQMAAQIGAVRAHPKVAIAALRRNAAVLVYPGGAEDVFRPHSQRHQIQFAGRQGFIKLALREGVPIIPVVSEGAHDTFWVLTDIYEQVQRLHEQGLPWLFGIDPEVFPIYLGLPWGVGLGPLPNIPLPVKIHTRVCSPIRFERYGRDAANDHAYVDACYQTVLEQMQYELDVLVAQVQAQSSAS